MLEERVGRLEKKGTPRPLFITAPSTKLQAVKKRRLVSPVTARHSTGKRYPRSPCRDATERNKAKLSPWTLSSTASAQADRPQTARRKATREGRAQALRAGQHDGSASCRAAGAAVTLAPPQRADTSCPLNKQTKRRAPRSTAPRARTTLTGVLSHPPGWHLGASGRCAALTDHVKGEIAESPFG